MHLNLTGEKDIRLLTVFSFNSWPRTSSTSRLYVARQSSDISYNPFTLLQVWMTISSPVFPSHLQHLLCLHSLLATLLPALLRKWNLSEKNCAELPPTASELAYSVLPPWLWINLPWSWVKPIRHLKDISPVNLPLSLSQHQFPSPLFSINIQSYYHFS